MQSDVRQILNRLRECCYPFTLLTGNRAEEALDSLRTFELEPGEQLSLRTGKGSDLLYVLDGQAEVHVDGLDPVRLDPQSTSKSPFRLQSEAPTVTIIPLNKLLVCRADGEVMDYLLSWETLAAGIGSDDGGAHDRIGTVRRSLAFRRLPLENVEEAFRRMRSLPVAAGQDIVRQGEPGDAFYVMEQGRAEVWQTGVYDDEPKLVGQLGPGDSFGEEALVLRGSRSATVRMVEPGVVLVLDKADFDELFHKAMIQRVPAPVARALIESGHVPLDVRYEEEFEEAHMPNSVLVPLHELRKRIPELDASAHYLVYCKSGGRSAVGTLLLRQRGFDAVSLEGGLRDWPYEVVTA